VCPEKVLGYGKVRDTMLEKPIVGVVDPDLGRK
jgi:hypothetical protein